MLTALRNIARTLLDVVTSVVETVVEVVTEVVHRPAALGFIGAFTGAIFLFSR